MKEIALPTTDFAENAVMTASRVSVVSWCIAPNIYQKGERRKMKAYVTVRDVILVLPVKDTQARKILHNLRRQKNKKGEIFEGSYRDTMLGKILAVPTPIFVEYFPETKSALNDIWKEQIKSTLGQEC